MKNVILILTVSVLFSSCALENGLVQENKLSLKDSGNTEIKVNDIFKELSVVHLENNRNCFMKYIIKIIPFKNHYYILGGAGQSRLYVFNSHGKFIRIIGAIGHGHGEYTDLSDFTIDKDRKRIVVLSDPHKILIYDLKGDFKFSRTLKEAGFWHISWNKNKFLFATKSFDNKDQLYLYDSDFNFLEKWGQAISGAFGGMPLMTSVLQNDNNKTYYFEETTRKIYSFDNLDMETAKTYDLAIPNPMPFDLFVHEDTFLKNQLKYDLVLDAIIVKNKILVTYVMNRKIMEKLMTLDNKPIVSGFCRGAWPKMFHGNSDEVLLTINANDYLSSKNTTFLGMKEKVLPGDNYLIIKCKLK